MVPENSFNPHGLAGSGLYRRCGYVAFWIFHSGPEIATLSQFSYPAANRYSFARAHCCDNANRYEYALHDTHSHPDSGSNIYNVTDPHKGPHVDIAANIYDSIRNSPASRHPNRDRDPSNRHNNPLMTPRDETPKELLAILFIRHDPCAIFPDL
jgi:hypothetical protein